MIDIKEKAACSGCGACSAVCPEGCIEMKKDDEGFLYPYADKNKCIHCSLCDKICPIKNQEAKKVEKVTCYAAYNKNDEERKNSSSGGIFVALAKKVISNGGVVFGAAFDGELHLRHISAKSLADLKALMGSKYLQSRTVESYIEVKDCLEQNKEVLFSGTPCQISGLKGFLGKEYEKLILVDIVCHGVPSPNFFSAYKSFLEKKYKSKVISVDFRNKKYGWKRYSVRVLFENGKEICENFIDNMYMKAFLKNVCLRTSCYDCAFKSIPKCSDLTIGDFWGCDHVLKEKNDDKGISLILVNSQRGYDFLNEIGNDIVCTSIDSNEALKFNPTAFRSVAFTPKRTKFFQMLGQKKMNFIIKSLCDDSFFCKLKAKLKYELQKFRE